MGLKVRDEFVCVGSLTGLQRLSISVNNKAPLDLSELTKLTWLNQNTSPVSRFPTSLVECVLRVECDTDLWPMTRLTALSLQLEGRPGDVPNAAEEPVPLRRAT